MSLIKSLKTSFFNQYSSKNELLGQALISEFLPIYYNNAKTTNKNVYIIEKVIKGSVVQAFNLDFRYMKKKTIINPEKLITQNNEPIIFKKCGKPKKINFNFEKNGYKINDIYFFTNRDFIGELEFLLKISFVTDNFVFFKSLDKHSDYFIFSFEELERMNPKLQ